MRRIEELNGMSREEFTRALGWVFEGSPWVAERAWERRPFGGVDELHAAMCAVMWEAGEERQLTLIRAHPDLVGRAALEGTLTAESKGEQAAAGLDRLSAEEIARFGESNERYKERFGFPFVICARENKKESILAGFRARLVNSREVEMQTALREIEKIARLRVWGWVELVLRRD